ncbi:MAG: hypothetical protein AMJ91_03570 [candidate division Zixibacteria bacterium SM23_73_3]|nr:MAG: hypothetical protein AMJ91_03570 [candidate division Zixibacteria bacterium SM23_73_3]
MIDKRKLILGIILFGSIWGGLEALGIRAMRGVEFFPTSPILALVAILILSASRMILKRPGTTLACGIVAAGFKGLCLPSIFFCQVTAVLLTAAIIDLAFTWAESRKLSSWISWGFVGLGASYLNYAVFGLVNTYLLRNIYWLERVHTIPNYVLVSGTYAALLSFLGILLGRELGRRSEPLFSRMEQIKAKAFSGGIILTSLGFWLLGVFLYR